MNVSTGYSGKLPKNYNAEVDPDPERWIPKRERTYYKGKRQKKGASVGRLPVAVCLQNEKKKYANGFALVTLYRILKVNESVKDR